MKRPTASAPLTQDGFTLVEVMVALFIFMTISLGLYFMTFSVNSMRTNRQVELRLSQQARAVMEQLLWGIQTDVAIPRAGLWQAETFVINPGATAVDFVGSDGTPRIVRLNNQNIEFVDNSGTTTLYDPNGPAAADPVRYQTSLVFTLSAPNVININLVLSQRVLDRWYHGSLTTQVAPRNAT